MTQERKNELYDKMLAWICEHIQNDEDLFLTLKGQLGMTQEEVYDSRIDGLDEFFVKDKIKQLADYAIRECCDNSENCYWSITYDELYYHFGADVTDSNENGKLLEKELRQRGNQRAHHDRGRHRNDLPSKVLPSVPRQSDKSQIRP